MKRMKRNRKLQIGSILAIFGGLGIILTPFLGGTALDRPWSFIVGFFVGMIAGMGGVLSVFGLLEKDKER